LYNVKGLQVVDSQIKVTGGGNTFSIYNAQFTITNSTPVTNVFSMDGLAGTNSLALYNTRAAMNNSTAIGISPLTLSASTLSNSTSLALPATSVANFVLGTSNATVAVAGNLAVTNTLNIATNGGFGPGTNTLFTYTGTLSGSLPTLGSTPGGPYTYSLDTSIAGQVNLIVLSPAPPAPTNFTATATNLLINLNWNAVSGATSYNLKRGTANNGPYPTIFSGLTATNYSDAAVTNAVTYYYVVTAVSDGESTNSLQASATPLPSSVATNIFWQVSSGQLQLFWPQDHLGWHLQIQTNSLNADLGDNWVNVPNSTTTTQIFIPINPTNGSVFLRMVYP
jgi:hypothetical protein